MRCLSDETLNEGFIPTTPVSWTTAIKFLYNFSYIIWLPDTESGFIVSPSQGCCQKLRNLFRRQWSSTTGFSSLAVVKTITKERLTWDAKQVLLAVEVWQEPQGSLMFINTSFCGSGVITNQRYGKCCF